MQHASCGSNTSISCISNTSVCRVWCIEMVARLSQLVTEYEDGLQRMWHMRQFSYGRQMLWDDSPNRCFLMYLFSDQALAIEFLKNDVVRNQVGPIQ
jgi:hypothetical protein